MPERAPIVGQQEPASSDESPDAYEPPVVEDLGTVETKTLTSIYM